MPQSKQTKPPIDMLTQNYLGRLQKLHDQYKDPESKAMVAEEQARIRALLKRSES